MSDKKHGGKRIGAGRPSGAANNKTLEKLAIKKEFDQRVFKKAEKLFFAQYVKAVGSIIIFRRDEVESGNGKTKVEYVQVTEPEEIKAFLDAHDGSDGEANGKYYFIQKIAPDNKAIDSMFDRAFGRATQSIEISDKLDVELSALKSKIEARANEKGVSYAGELKFFLENFAENVKPEIKQKLSDELDSDYSNQQIH